MDNHFDRIRQLDLWSGPIDIEPVKGGITNANYRVSDGKNRYFLRTGMDIPVHGIMRFNELQASIAAAACGISPRLIHHQPGFLIFEYIEAKTLTPGDVRAPHTLKKILNLLKMCHQEIKNHLRGPAMIFWVFHVIRDYAHSLREINSRSLPLLPQLLKAADDLERVIGAIDIAYGHNDLLSANFMDDGDRIWLVDWDYAGFNSPLFDLANLCSNNEMKSDQEHSFLEDYFQMKPSPDLWKRYMAMKVASLLRETMWSMISEHYSHLDFDYVAYTQDYFDRFYQAYDNFRGMT